MSKTGLDGMRVRIAAIGGAGEHDGRTGRCLAWAPSPPLLGTEPAILRIEVVAKAGDGCDALPQALNLLPVVDGPRDWWTGPPRAARTSTLAARWRGRRLKSDQVALGCSRLAAVRPGRARPRGPTGPARSCKADTGGRAVRPPETVVGVERPSAPPGCPT